MLAVSIYNHYKRLRAQQTDKDRDDVPRLDKSNVLLIGPTGSGENLHTLSSFIYKCYNSFYLTSF